MKEYNVGHILYLNIITLFVLSVKGILVSIFKLHIDGHQT